MSSSLHASSTKGPQSEDVVGLPRPRPVALLLVEHQTIVREAVAAMLEREPGVSAVATAANLNAAVTVGHPVDVVISDIDLPDARGVEVVRALSRRFPSAAVLVLSAVDQPVDVLEALAEGAAGYLLKSAETEDLFAAIRALARGETYLQPSLGVAMARHPTGRAPGPGSGLAGRLTPKEIEVLHRLALGYTNAEIAQRIGVSVRTVETHRARIGQKLGGRTRADLVREARRFGLGEREPDDG